MQTIALTVPRRIAIHGQPARAEGIPCAPLAFPEKAHLERCAAPPRLERATGAHHTASWGYRFGFPVRATAVFKGRLVTEPRVSGNGGNDCADRERRE